MSHPRDKLIGRIAKEQARLADLQCEVERSRRRLADLLPFEELWACSVQFELKDTTVRVASIPDLIHLKRLAGRPQDQADIQQVEAILQ